MNYSDPTKLGILACPGAEKFAYMVIRRLSSIYKFRFERKSKALAERYNKSREEITRKINLYNDIQTSRLFNQGDIDKFRPPLFRVDAHFSWFPNGEVKSEILDSIRGMDLFIFQDVENHLPVKFNDDTDERILSVNDHMFNVYVTVDAAVQAGAARITLVMPTYPYSRQHKKKGREGLTAARVGQTLEFLGVNRIITLDIHSREIENSFRNLRLENLHASYQIIRKLADIVDVRSDDFVVLSPDTGAVDRNKFYASALQKPLALLYKERDYSKITKNANDTNITEIKLLGDVKGKIVFMADDMLGTGGTLLKAMRFLKEQGASKVICAISLPLFSASAIQDFDNAFKEGLFYKIIGTNAIAHDKLLEMEWYIQVDITTLFAQIISLLHHDRSLSPMLDNRRLIAKKIRTSINPGSSSSEPSS